MELTPPSDDGEPSSSSQEEDQEESEGDSPEEQRLGLTPPSGQDEQGEGSRRRW